MFVNFKVIEILFIVGVVMNGIEVKVKVCIIVRVNIVWFVGGVGEEIIIVCVGEGIVLIIGFSKYYIEVFENLDNIFKIVLSKGLDLGIVFEILLIDIVDVDISKNIGVDL